MYSLQTSGHVGDVLFAVLSRRCARGDRRGRCGRSQQPAINHQRTAYASAECRSTTFFAPRAAPCHTSPSSAAWASFKRARSCCGLRILSSSVPVLPQDAPASSGCIFHRARPDPGAAMPIGWRCHGEFRIPPMGFTRRASAGMGFSVEALAEKDLSVGVAPTALTFVTPISSRSRIASLLRILSFGHAPTAVDCQYLAGDEFGLVGEEVDGRSVQIGRLAYSAAV